LLATERAGNYRMPAVDWTPPVRYRRRLIILLRLGAPAHCIAKPA
jgi:hypothetical protein